MLERRGDIGAVEEIADLLVGPHIGAAGAGVVVGAEDGADLVVAETGGENIRGAVAARIGDQDDRTIITLADVVAELRRRDRKTGRKGRAGLGRPHQRCRPLAERRHALAQ